MKFVKILVPLLSALAIGGAVDVSSAAQCARFPASGTAPWPGLGGFSAPALTCADTTKANVTADHRTANEQVISRLIKVGPTGKGTADSFGFHSSGGTSCRATIKVLNQDKFGPCLTGSRRPVSWGATLRND